MKAWRDYEIIGNARPIKDLEFSDYGRSPRFLPGWWILPGLVIGAMLIGVGMASAQQAPFEPYTINAQEHQALMTYLGDVPAKYAVPLMQQFNQFEQQAQGMAAQKRAAEERAKAEKPKAEPKK